LDKVPTLSTFDIVIAQIKYTKMQIKILRPDFNKQARLSDDLKLRLAKANQVQASTIYSWLRFNDPMITTATNLFILKDHFKVLDINELLVSVQETAEQN